MRHIHTHKMEKRLNDNGNNQIVQIFVSRYKIEFQNIESHHKTGKHWEGVTIQHDGSVIVMIPDQMQLVHTIHPIW